MKNQEILLLTIFTLITVIAWIAFDLYHATTMSTVSKTQEELITPLDPTFDRNVINQLKNNQ